MSSPRWTCNGNSKRSRDEGRGPRRSRFVAKVRVYELAKEFGVESKTVLNKLTEMGEFVRSASSTIEPPVVRKLRCPAPAPAAYLAPARVLQVPQVARVLRVLQVLRVPPPRDRAPRDP